MRSLLAGVVALFLIVACGTASTHRIPASAAAQPIHEQLDGAGVAAPPTITIAPPAPAPPDPARAGLSIKVPSLGIDLPLVEGNGLEPELNVADHFPGMKWPGQGGRSFIYAHARPGMFGALLGAYPVGAEVDITQPGGPVLRYTITSYTANWPVTNTSILAPADHEELILYTCTSWEYSDPKIVAIALPK